MSFSLVAVSRRVGMGSLILGAFTSVLLRAASVSWDGGGDGTSWHDPLNWSADTLPTSADNVTIALPGAVVAHSSTTATTVIASLVCPQELRLTFGSLTVTGDSVFAGGTLRLLGGTFVGSPQIIAGKLEPRSLNAPVTFNLFDACELIGEVAGLATVRVQGSFAHGEGVVTWSGLRNLHGELRLESLANPVRAKVRTVSDDGTRHGFIYVQPTGRLTAGQGAGGERLIASELHLRGRVGVTGGATLRQAPELASVTYTQFDGAQVETDATSMFQLGSAHAAILGGSISGRMVAGTHSLETSGSATGPSPLILAGRVRLREHSAANLTLLVQGNNQFGDATLQANGDTLAPGETWPIVPIFGPIRCESINLGHPVTLDGVRGGFWIKPTGSLTFAPGTGGSRNFAENSILRNDGRIEVLSGTASVLPNGYYGTDGGVTVGDFFVRGSQIAFGSAPATANELLVIGPDNRLSPATTAIPAGQTVRLRGENLAGDAALALPANLDLHGSLILDTRNLAYFTRATVTEGATLHIRPGGSLVAASGSGGIRVLNGAVLNEGTVSVAADRVLRQENTTPASFTQRAGSLTVEAGGRFEQRSGVFRHEGGTVTGEVVVGNGTLDVAASATVPTTFILAGQSALLGNASPVATVWLRGANDFGDAILNLAGAVLNRGTLRLESRNIGYPCRILCAEGASLVNEGRLEVNVGSGGQRRFDGSFVQRGEIAVEPDYGVEFRGSFEVDGGSVTGPHDLFNVALLLTAAPTVPSVYRVVGQAGQLLTDIPAGMHLQLLGDNRYGDARLTAAGDVANRGRVELTSANLGYTERLTLTTGTFLNAAGGTLEFAAGSGGRRYLEAPLDNRGSVVIGGNLEGYFGRGGGTSRSRGALTGGSTYVQFTGPFVNEAGATASLAGTLRANDGFFNDGTLQVGGPGAAGSLSVYGPFTQSAGARLELDVLSTAAGTGYDRLLQYEAALNLAGALALNSAGFTPAAGAQFDVLGTQLAFTGTFQPVTGLSLGANLGFNTDYSATLLRLTATERAGDLTPPQITQQPLPRFAALGESASFTVTATGSEPLGYQWFRNGTLLGGQTAATLTIPSVGGGDFAGYTCRVSNAAGSVVSLPATLQSPGPTVSLADAVRTTLPPVEGDGVLLDLFNGVGGDTTPTPEALTGLAPSGSVFAPVIDFPSPGAVVNVGGQFEVFFADTTTPPAQVLGLAAANFTLRHQFLLRVSPDLDLDATRPGIQLTLGVGSDDGFHLRAGSQALGSAGVRGFSYSWMNVTFEDRGLYPVTLLFAANATGQSGLEFAWKTAADPAGEIVPQAALYSSPDIGDRRVTFEELPAGSVVTDQFAGEGVVFNATAGLVITDAKPDRFVPVSGDRVFGDPATSGAAAGVVELEFVDPANGAHAVTDFVRFFVVDAETAGAVVTALDPDGATLLTRELHGGAGAQERVLLRVANISKVRVTLGSGADSVALDSLVFTTPTAFNRAPTLAALSDATLDEGQTLTFTAVGSDPDGDPITYGLVPPAPSGATMDPVTGAFSWAPNELQGPGTFPLTVSVTDDQVPPATATRTFQVTVREVNQPPVMPAVPELVHDQPGTFRFRVVASDPDFQVLTHRVELQANQHLTPLNAFMDAGDEFVWVVPEAAPAAIYRGTFFASDGTVEVSQPFAVRLVRIPDLRLTALSAAAEIETQAESPLTFRVENLGSGIAPASVVRVWATLDDTFDGRDPELGAYSVPALLPGTSVERTVPQIWPREPGSYRLVALADGADAVAERSEDNNYLAPTNRVQILPAYSATVATTTTVAPAGTPVEFTGSAHYRNGQPASQVVVSVQVRVRETTRNLGALTDAVGQFRLTFQPLPDEAGAYAIGACHPGEATAPEQDSFHLVHLGFEPAALTVTGPALRPLTNPVVLVNLGELPLTGLTVQTEPSLASLQVRLIPPALLPADGSVELPLVIESTLDAALETNLNLTLTSAEGARRTLPLTVKLLPLQARLVALPGALDATVIRSNQTVVEFQIRNEGSLASDPVQLVPPPLTWIRPGTTLPLPSLPPGASHTLTLLLQPDGTVPVGDAGGALLLTGGASLLSVPFNFRVRDDLLGSLLVEAVDEYTFYAPGQPRLTNALVSLRRKSDGTLIGEQRTDASGQVRFEGLTEGIYDLGVVATNHGAFGEPIRILAGRTLEKQTFLARQNVHYRFHVEETGVADETRMVVEAVFETLAPIPVLTIEPAFVPLGQFSPEGGQIEFKVTNHGVLAAQNARFRWASGGNLIFEPLVSSLGDLGGRSSVTIPVRVLHDADRDGRQDGIVAAAMRASRPRRQDQTPGEAANRPACPGSPAVDFDLQCGTNTYTFTVGGQTDGACGGPIAAYVNQDGGAPYGPFPTFTFYPDEGPACDPCSIEIGGIYARCYFNILAPGALECAESLANYVNSESLGEALLNLYEVIDACGIELKIPEGNLPDLPPGGNPNSPYRKGLSLKKPRLTLDKDKPDVGKGPPDDATEEALDGIPIPERLRELIKCLKDLACSCRTGAECPENIDDIIDTLLDGLEDGFNPDPDSSDRPAVARATPARHATDPRILPGQVGVRQQYARLAAVMELFHSYYGGEDWIGGLDNAGTTNFHGAFTAVTRPDSADGRTISAAERAGLLALEPLPDLIDTNEVAQFADRWNRSIEYYGRGWFSVTNVPAGESTDFIAVDRFDKAQYAARLAFARWRQDNAADPTYAIFEATEVLYNNMVEAANSGGICARVRLRLDQNAVQTRQGFTASLEMENHGGAPLTALGVTLDIRDMDGLPVAESQFALLPPHVTGFSAVNGTGTLEAGAAGLASWLIVPGHDAAPTNAPVTYTVGATLVYVQDGYVLTVPLAPTTISVLPQPRLHVAYFHERDVFADDPFTAPIEPSIPYSLGVRVENRGFGTARALRIESSQPKIIENDKGLLIDFNLFATEVAGLGVTPSLTAEFGDVVPSASKTARWLFRSSLQGQFVNYSATFQHLGPLSGRPEFSLVESTEIHEMIHLVRVQGVPDDGTFDFLVNDQLDDDFLPDAVHFSQGGSAPVRVVRIGSYDGAPSGGDTEVVLTADVPAGYVYFRLPDPGNGQWQIHSVRRPGGGALAAENVWQTDRTFVAGARRPRYENNLHLFDHFATAGPVNLTLHFAPPTLLAGADAVARPDNSAVIKIPIAQLLVNDTGANGDLNLLSSVGNAQPPGATVALIGGFVVYTAPSAMAGNGTFDYTLLAGPGGATSTATVTVTQVTLPPDPEPNTGRAVIVGDSVVLSFNGVPGYQYRVQFATQAASPYVWREFDPPALLTAPTSGVLTFTDVAPPEPVRFYRFIPHP